MGGIVLDDAVARAWVAGAHDALSRARERIDAVNVFPVPDSDTGTNVLLTVAGGARAVDDARPGPGADAVLAAFARGCLRSARGNSGVIVSQYVAGFARRVGAAADATQVAAALGSAARAARQAMADPQEGTVLTLADAVADAAAEAAAASAPLPALLAQVLDDARASLGDISSRHPVLRRSGVLDAGACALLVVLDALAGAVAGRHPGLGWLPAVGFEEQTVQHGDGGAYEVMLLVRVPQDAEVAGPLRSALGAVGDSVAVVGDRDWLHVHVHTDDPAAAIAACVVGRREQAVVRLVEGGHGQSADEPAWGVVVCTRAPALAAWYAATGAVALVACPEEPLRAEHVARAVADAGGARVLLVPGDAVDDAVLAEVAAVHGDGVRVAPARGELEAVVATLASVSSADPAAGARDALTRLRVVASVGDAGVDVVADAVAGIDGIDGGESLTVLHREAFDDDMRARVLAAAGDREVAFVGPTGRGPLVVVGVD
ncbi:DAK2 domain-containing protein [Cellulomonas sp. HZM]|uniref:DAK2 domain-containing protein n=1 Tax=Cellulomonas sp. HZM TaxID=1454010 RepID=UPI0006902DDD|nr:DAK2 domain-containing protein [Cellulomonas sp. HZM]